MIRIKNAYVVLVLLGLCGIAAAQQTTHVPAARAAHEWSVATRIAPGVTYTRMRVALPRPMSIHCMRIDTREPGLRFHTTGRHSQWREDTEETLRMTTRDFMRESRTAGVNMVAAINADAFEPWPAPWNQRTATNLRGLAVSDGVVVSSASDAPSFVVDQSGRAAVVESGSETEEIQVAVSGFAIVLWNGEAINGNDSVHPRTGIGVSRDARHVFFLVIDGRRHASHGATTEEVGRWLLYYGADDGINLDGGGSSSMAKYDAEAPEDGVVLLNRPVGDGTNWLEREESAERENFVPAERANGNNLGVIVSR